MKKKKKPKQIEILIEPKLIYLDGNIIVASAPDCTIK